MSDPRASGRPAVHQILATLGYGDAIGHEALGIRRALRAAGFASEIFVQTADPRLEHLTRDYRDLIGESDASHVLIHHFSIGSRASRVAFALPARMILVYHNITPPEYFIDVNPLLVQLCYNGRRELAAYAPRCELALGDSEFNRRELDALGFPATDVLPVVPDFSHLDVEPGGLLVDAFDDAWTNILFVGRVIPNKRLEDVIRFFRAYQTAYNPRSRLLLAGAYGGFEAYLAMLHHLVADLRVTDVHFLGHVSDEELTAYYDIADLFLCASEHEGFCVPIVEAFYKRVPVLAFAATAVPATMDGGGVLFRTKDPDVVAGLMDEVLSDAALQERILRSQDAALDRLRGRDFGATLVRFVERVLRAPRRPRPAVAPDFWRQFADTERLDDLRIERPSIFKGLPKPPGPPRV
jgi:glycosyltransferase involved in cell wall biosynthesis